jgi:hypothetical protein
MRDFEDVDGNCNESQPCGDDELDTWDWDFDWDLDEIGTDCEPGASWIIQRIFHSDPAHPARSRASRNQVRRTRDQPVRAPKPNVYPQLEGTCVWNRLPSLAVCCLPAEVGKLL